MKKSSSEQRKAVCEGCGTRASRRRTLLGLALGLPFIDLVHAAEKGPTTQRPTTGDQFVFVLGDRKGHEIKVEDLPLGGPQQLAYPMDPATKVVRDGSRLNQVLLIRLDPSSLNAETQARSAEGVVAYSAICTHQGCDVSQWKADSNRLLCVCHGTEYDPADRASVTFGPAPRRLPMLPVKVDDGVVVVASPFQGKPGFQDM